MLSSWSYFVFLLLFTCWWESVKSVTSVALSIVLTQWEWTEFTGSQKHVNAAKTIQPSLCCWHCISHITFAQSMHMITFPFRHLIFCVVFSSPSTCTCFFTCIFLLLTQKQFNYSLRGCLLTYKCGNIRTLGGNSLCFSIVYPNVYNN